MLLWYLLEFFLVLAVGVHVCCLGLFVLCFGGEVYGSIASFAVIVCNQMIMILFILHVQFVSLGFVAACLESGRNFWNLLILHHKNVHLSLSIEKFLIEGQLKISIYTYTYLFKWNGGEYSQWCFFHLYALLFLK